jgi:hypothetical protein
MALIAMFYWGMPCEASPWLCLLPQKKKILCKQKISVTSNLRYMYGVLNVDEIKKLIIQLGYTLRDERFEPN